MRSSRAIHVVSCHAEGEVGDVIVGGVAPPPGDTLWAQRDFIASDGTLRELMLNEPRGGVFRHVNLLVPPKDPRAAMGFIIMEPEDTPPMSGSNAMCVATVLLETGILQMHEPETTLTLEAPGGLIGVEARCAAGKVERVRITNVPSFAVLLDAPLEVPGLPPLTVDTAYGGDSFVFASADALGFALTADEAGDLAAAGMAITRAANEELGFSHPTNPAWRHISFCAIYREVGPGKVRNAVAIRPGKIDRSPTGTALSAHLARLSARGRLGEGGTLVAESIIGTCFEGRIEAATTVGDRSAIVPSVAGRAWITGIHQHLLDPDDPFPRGYRLGDTWPNLTP